MPSLDGGGVTCATSNVPAFARVRSGNATDEKGATMKIKSAKIGPMPRPMPEGMFDPMPSVKVTLENGDEKELFTFYPDEISFTEQELVGLTIQEAHSLKRVKEIDYL